jgi:hypothetical protein
VSHSPDMHDAWYETAFRKYADLLEKNLISPNSDSCPNLTRNNPYFSGLEKVQVTYM